MRHLEISLRQNYRTRKKLLTVPASAIFDYIQMEMPSVSVPGSDGTLRTVAIVGELFVKSRNPNGITFSFLRRVFYA